MKPPLIRRIRDNHGVEHATIAVLLEQGARPPLGGNALSGGFLVLGKVSTGNVAAAAVEAVQRLQAGQRELAVSPYCGTNIAVGAIVGGFASGLLTSRRRRRSPGLQAIIGAALIAALIGRPLGSVVQRHVTTSGDIGDLRVADVRRLIGGPLPIHLVTTGYTDRQDS